MQVAGVFSDLIERIAAWPRASELLVEALEEMAAALRRARGTGRHRPDDFELQHTAVVLDHFEPRAVEQHRANL